MKLLQLIVFFPISVLYALITTLRNFLFDKAIISSVKSNHFSVVVGNLSVGGTGKTPLIKYLVQNLDFNKPAILSRGYKRKTNGFIKVSSTSTISEVGDEPKMLQSYADTFVCESRVEGDQKIPMDHDALLLDDAFQHRHIVADLYILVTPYHRLFAQDWPMPSGRLRECRRGAKRADIVIISKVPKDAHDLESKAEEIKKYNSSAPIYFCRYINSIPTNNHNSTLMANEKIIAFSALGNNKALKTYCKRNFHLQSFYGFRDHHSYSLSDLKTVFSNSYDFKFVTTAKDYVKIKDICTEEELKRIYYTDTTVVFLNEEEHFQNIIKTAYKRFHTAS